MSKSAQTKSKPVRALKSREDSTRERVLEFLADMTKMAENGEIDGFVAVCYRKKVGGSISHRYISTGGSANAVMTEVYGLVYGLLQAMNVKLEDV